MPCETTRARLEELDVADFPSLLHLHDCASCQSYAEGIVAMESSLVADVDSFVAAGDFDDEWQRAIAVAPERRRAWPWMLSGTATLLAAAAALLLAVRTPELPPRPPVATPVQEPEPVQDPVTPTPAAVTPEPELPAPAPVPVRKPSRVRPVPKPVVVPPPRPRPDPAPAPKPAVQEHPVPVTRVAPVPMSAPRPVSSAGTAPVEQTLRLTAPSDVLVRVRCDGRSRRSRTGRIVIPTSVPCSIELDGNLVGTAGPGAFILTAGGELRPR